MGRNPICRSNKLWICLRCLKSCFNGFEEGPSFHLQPQFIRYSPDDGDLFCIHRTTDRTTLQFPAHLPVTAGDKHRHQEDSQKWTRSGRRNEHRGFYDAVEETHSETDSHDDQTVHDGYRLYAVQLVLVLHAVQGGNRSQEVLEGDRRQGVEDGDVQAEGGVEQAGHEEAQDPGEVVKSVFDEEREDFVVLLDVAGCEGVAVIIGCVDHHSHDPGQAEEHRYHRHVHHEGSAKAYS